MTPETHMATLKAELLALHAELTHQLGLIETELQSHQNPDWDDLATEREDDQVLEARGIAGQHDLRLIEAALQRVYDGSYGICAKCGAQIDPARLKSLPATPFCKHCAV